MLRRALYEGLSPFDFAVFSSLKPSLTGNLKVFNPIMFLLFVQTLHQGHFLKQI